ncbi:MAG: hypothetical protein KIT09_30755 [Bryobacteraceae bacterium]|nr:hypothetical protein [Bryobacteraceae bacterium]
MGIRFYPAILTAALGLTAFGADLKLNVRIYNYAQVPPGTLARVQDVAGSILRAAGVEATWRLCSATGNEPGRDPECGNARTPTDLVLSILPHKMADRLATDRSVYGTSFGAAEGDFASSASIFYDRIEDLAKRRRDPCPLLVGNFLAHEIGHLLLGPDSHSRTGIMSIPFDAMQVRRALWGTLRFTPEEAARIRSEVARRMEASVSQREDESGCHRSSSHASVLFPLAEG